MRIIDMTTIKLGVLITEIANDLNQKSKPELVDILHECDDRLVVDKGSRRMGAWLVKQVVVALLDPD